RGACLAERRGEEQQSERWQARADEIRAEILERGVHGRGVFRQHYDTDALDASNLPVPLVRFLPPERERVGATLCATRDELSGVGARERGGARRPLGSRARGPANTGPAHRPAPKVWGPRGVGVRSGNAALGGRGRDDHRVCPLRLRGPRDNELPRFASLWSAG